MLKKTMILVAALAVVAMVAEVAGCKKSAEKPAGSRKAYQPVASGEMGGGARYGRKSPEGVRSQDRAALPARRPGPAPSARADAMSAALHSLAGGQGSGLLASKSSARPGRGYMRRLRIGRPPVAPGSVPVVKKNTEDYTNYGINPFVDAVRDPRSTFAIDVDTASYAICRRKLRSGQVPPQSAVRVEEFVNYFNYGYQGPTQDPFLVHIDGAPSPFQKGRHFLRIGIQGKQISKAARKPVHLTFLVDTSGSMQSADKLPLAKRAMRILLNQLKPGDTVAIATYAGDVRRVLSPTGMDKRAQIEDALYALTAGGGTAMNDGMKVAYKMASEAFVKGHVNRVIVLSDGDANIGRTSWKQMHAEIRHYADKGITMSTVGFGMGNYKDTRMEMLANKGNGNYYYVDGLSEARKIFAKQVTGTLQVIAKDVKVQVIFNPALVAKHRLVGYENRKLAHRDFDNDKVDAGELGAGHTVTALYELELRQPGQPVGGNAAALAAFQTKPNMLALVRLRHKAPQTAKGARSKLIEGYFPKNLLARDTRQAPKSFQLALAVAAFAEKLRGSVHAKEWTLIGIAQLAEKGVTTTVPEQAEFLTLVQKAKALGI